MHRPSWAACYLEIPFERYGRSFDGCDCYGLVYLIYNSEFSITLPEFNIKYDTISEKHEAILERLNQFVPVQDAEVGDILLFRIHGYPMHMGVAINAHEMLHSFNGADSVIEAYDGLVWRNRIYGRYRYEPSRCAA